MGDDDEYDVSDYDKYDAEDVDEDEENGEEEDDGVDDNQDEEDDDEEDDAADAEQRDVEVNSYEEEGSEGSLDNVVDSRDCKIPLELGMTFSSLAQIKDIVKAYGVENGYGIQFVKSDKTRLRAVCSNGCKWVLHASKLNSELSFQIRTLNDIHNCARMVHNKLASSKWIAQKYLSRFKSQLDWNISSIIETVQREVGVTITPIMAYRARRKARLSNDGDAEEQYKLLWSYAAEIRRSNPGSAFVVDLQEVPQSTSRRFRRAYMCLRACRDGLVTAGRRVLCLDGCHLKGHCTGQLLTAVSIDGNDGLYPVAFAVVESECKDSWKWFLEQLMNDVQRSIDLTWTFICDQQKGLVPALEEIVPHHEHRFCLRHLYSNFKNKFPGKLYKEVIWKASTATTSNAFKREMNRFAAIDKVAYAAWCKTDPKYWSKHAFSPISKCDIRLNNLSECFNAMILPARDKPILTLFEMIRKSLMTRIPEKQKEMQQCTGLLCPRIRNKLAKLENASRNWSHTAAGGNMFEVSNGNDQYIVDLNIPSCSCFAWTLTGIPCVHSIPCIRYLRRDVEEYVHEHYHRQNFVDMYSHYIAPVNGMSMWPEIVSPIIIPPLQRKQPGRPRKKRIRDTDEPESSTNVSKINRVMRCSKCNGVGHNVRRCEGVNSSTSTPTIHRAGSGRGKGRGRERGSGRGRESGRGRGV